MNSSIRTALKSIGLPDFTDFSGQHLGPSEPYIERIGMPPAPMLDEYESSINRVIIRVALRAGRVCGLIVMWPKTDYFYVDNVAVSPEGQGHGVGAALLLHADQEAVAAGRDEIRLYTHETMTENIDYCPRRGYVETHRASEAGYRRSTSRRRLLDGGTS